MEKYTTRSSMHPPPPNSLISFYYISADAFQALKHALPKHPQPLSLATSGILHFEQVNKVWNKCQDWTIILHQP